MVLLYRNKNYIKFFRNGHTVGPFFQSLIQNCSYHGNKKYMALRSKHRTRNLFASVENVHAVRRQEKYCMRYRDKCGVRSEKFVPIGKLPAPRWHWDDDLTDDNSTFACNIKVEDSEILNKQSDGFCPLKDKQWEPAPWTSGSMRCGAIGIKLGVHYMWLKDGTQVSTTLIQVIDCRVIKLFSKDNYNGSNAAMILGANTASNFYKNENYTGFCLNAGIPVKKKCFRFIVTENAKLKPGTQILASHFKVGQHVHLSARTVGYGHAGVIQRFHMKGGPATHGATKWHRRVGSIAASGHRPMKGRRLPGQLGGTYETARSRVILRINTRYNVIYVRGRIPGHVNCLVKVQDAFQKKIKIKSDSDEKDQIGPFPTFYPDKFDGILPENLYCETVDSFCDQSIVFANESV